MRPFFLLFLLFLFPLQVRAFDVPPVKGYVNDYAGLLSPSVQNQVEVFLRNFEMSDSTQIVVVTLNDLQGEPVEMAALEIAAKWGVGQKGKDNGALLLIARSDRKIRIEVGRGLEGRLTDLLAGRIIDNEISPRFKQGDFEGGVVAGVSAMAQSVRGEYQGTGKTARKKRSAGPWWIFPLLFFALPLLSRFSSSSRGHGRHGGGFWIGGGGFGGGFGGGGGGGFSGGGGGFSGGGSSGSW